MNACKSRERTIRPSNGSLIVGMALLCIAACGQDQTSGVSQDRRPAASNSGSAGCEGRNFDRSREIIEVAWLGGLQIAVYMVNTDDTMGGINRLVTLSNNLNAEAQKLPHACQALIRAWSDQIGKAFGGGGGYSGGTNCMGGVCCDSSSCY